MRRKIKKCAILATLVIFAFVNGTSSTLVTGRIDTSQNTDLVIYTYDSLLADPYYDIVGNFSVSSGISKDNIQIIRFSDANAIVTRLITEKDDPQADVVVGIDNTLIHLIKDKSEVLEPFSPPVIDDIDSNLIQNLDPDLYLIPYDYGIISLYFQNEVINSTTHPEITNLTLDNLLDSDLLSMLIVENPKHSSPGLGFLLWTIAVYGDPLYDIDGLLHKNWRSWWNISRHEILLTDSWGDAFEIFFTPEEEKPIMVSYGTSPGYSYCQWADDSTSAVVTHENAQQNAWLQIEGIGLVKGATHQANGKEFINWFLSSSFQSNIPEHQWMYPANTEVVLPECFVQSSIHPDEVTRLNDLIPPTVLAEHLTQWTDEWEQVYVLGYTEIPEQIPSLIFPQVLFGLTILSIPVLLKKRKRK
jgi:thiamine transport system substrate-binding protein